jgi:hypothetical protein
MIPPVPEPLERHYHQVRVKLGLRLHNFVKLEEEEITIRMRRRFHIHAGVFCMLGLLSYLSVIDVVSITIVAAASPMIQVALEYIDQVGQF